MADLKATKVTIAPKGIATGKIPWGSAVYMRRATVRDYLRLALRLRFRAIAYLLKDRKYRGMLSPASSSDPGKVVIGVATGPNTILVGVDPGIEPSCDEVVDDG